jgi:hypothetical protein
MHVCFCVQLALGCVCCQNRIDWTQLTKRKLFKSMAKHTSTNRHAEASEPMPSDNTLRAEVARNCLL